jgi:hypothetical protein
MLLDGSNSRHTSKILTVTSVQRRGIKGARPRPGVLLSERLVKFLHIPTGHVREYASPPVRG